jgi:hypothetical protein
MQKQRAEDKNSNARSNQPSQSPTTILALLQSLNGKTNDAMSSQIPYDNRLFLEPEHSMQAQNRSDSPIPEKPEDPSTLTL